MTPLATLDDLLDFFGLPDSIDIVYAKDVPEPYQTLLVHNRHMTVTLEEYWKSSVSVKVLAHKDASPLYTRRISLSDERGTPIEYGAVQLDFDACTPEVAEAIRKQSSPLGRILIDHDVMTSINPRFYFRLTPSDENVTTFSLPSKAALFGRFATIEFNSQPAMTLIELMPEGLELRP